MLQKNVNDDIYQIEQALSSAEDDFFKAILAYFASLKSATTLKLIRQYLDAGDIEAIVAHFETLAKPLGEVVEDTIINAGRQEAKALAPKAQRAINAQANGIKPQIVLTFDPGNARATEIIRNRKTTLIREITDSIRESVYNTVAEGLAAGSNSRKIAGQIGERVGLTRFQENAVQNYRRMLQAGSQDALSRALRDRRYDRTIAAGKPLSSEQIDKMVAAYRQKYLRYRGETIARTEAGRALSEAQDEALRQTIEETGLTATRTWRATRDARTRDTHVTLNGQTKGVDELFESVSGARLRYPRDPNAPASETVQCRCVLTTSLK